MEMTDSIEFLHIKGFCVALQLKIEKKTFDRFRRPFVTDKYITVVQWEEIIRNIEKVVQKRSLLKIGSPDELRITNEEEELIVDDSLCVKSQIVPKQQSYIDFKKLKLDYKLGWIMTVNITRTSHHAKLDAKPHPRSNNEETEYKPENSTNSNSINVSVRSQYTASRKRSTEQRTSPEYFPRCTGVTPVKYTPSKIAQNNNNNIESDEDKDVPQKPSKSSTLQRDLFGKESSDNSDEDNDEVPKKTEKPTVKKRVLMDNKVEETEFPAGRKPKKRVEHTPSTSNGDHQTRSIKRSKLDERQPSLDCWMSTAKSGASKRVDSPIVKSAKRTKAKSSAKTVRPAKPIDLTDPMAGISDEQIHKMDHFIEKFKQKEIENNKRRLELEDLEIMNCKNLSNVVLKTMIKNFTPTINEFFELATVDNPKLKKDYNHMLITTSGVLTENQISFVLQEIENQRDVNDRGQHESMLIETILPEFIIHVLCTQFSLNKEEALEQLAKQEERQSLFPNDDSIL